MDVQTRNWLTWWKLRGEPHTFLLARLLTMPHKVFFVVCPAHFGSVPENGVSFGLGRVSSMDQEEGDPRQWYAEKYRCVANNQLMKTDSTRHLLLEDARGQIYAWIREGSG